MILQRRLLRRYIARRFLMTIAGTFGMCAILIFMIDIVELLRQAGKFGRVPSFQIAWMALLRLPAYTEILLPFSVLVGAIGALLLFSRKSELAVMRAAGMSAWQFVRPGLAVAFWIGVLSVIAYNPLAAAARAESERLFAEAFGREVTVLRSDGSGAWLRQDGIDGPSVVNAGSVTGGWQHPHFGDVHSVRPEGTLRRAGRWRPARQLGDGYWHHRERAGLEGRPGGRILRRLYGQHVPHAGARGGRSRDGAVAVGLGASRADRSH